MVLQKPHYQIGKLAASLGGSLSVSRRDTGSKLRMDDPLVSAWPSHVIAAMTGAKAQFLNVPSRGSKRTES